MLVLNTMQHCSVSLRVLKLVSAWIILVVLLFGGSSANPIAPHQSNLDVKHKRPLQTFRPYNVAHRGSSGHIPEETTAAYLRAIEEDADFIEADIVASKDGHLICFHDVTFDATTDIADRTEFANRKRTYEVERVNMTGFFVGPPTDLVSRAHALDLQVHPYTFRNENKYLHFNFHHDPYAEYEYWLKEIGVDGLFTDFPGSLPNYQECRMPYPGRENI